MTNAVDLKTKYSGTEWFGNIPNNWEVIKIKYLFGESKEKVLAEGYDILSLTLNGIKVRDVSTNEGQLPASFDNYKLVKKGYIVFNPMDLRRGFVDSSIYEGIISPAYIVLDCKEKVDTYFFKYFFQWHYNDQIFYHMGRGVSEDHRWTLEEKVLFNYKIVLPPLPTQKAIAKYLDYKTEQILKFIDDKLKLISLLEEQKKVIIYETVSKGLDLNVKTKFSGIEWLGDMPEHWELRKITRIFDSIGSGTTPNTSNREYYEKGEIKWVNTGDLNDGYLDDCEKRITELAVSENPTLRTYPKNSLIIALYGATIGKLGILNFEATVNQACCVMSKTKVADIKFMYYWFLSNKNNLIMMGYGGGQPNISQDVIKSLKVPLPAIEKQKEIVDYLDNKILKIDQAISTVKKEIELIEEYRRSLICQAVTGKIETLLKEK